MARRFQINIMSLPTVYEYQIDRESFLLELKKFSFCDFNIENWNIVSSIK